MERATNTENKICFWLVGREDFNCFRKKTQPYFKVELYWYQHCYIGISVCVSKVNLIENKHIFNSYFIFSNEKTHSPSIWTMEGRSLWNVYLTILDTRLYFDQFKLISPFFSTTDRVLCKTIKLLKELLCPLELVSSHLTQNMFQCFKAV